MTAARTTLTGRLGVPGAPGTWCHAGTVTAYATLRTAAVDGATVAGAVHTAVGSDGTWTLELLHYRDPAVVPQVPEGTATWTIRFEDVRATVNGQQVVVEVEQVPIDPGPGVVAFDQVQTVPLPVGSWIVRSPVEAVWYRIETDETAGTSTVVNALDGSVVYDGPAFGPEAEAAFFTIYYSPVMTLLEHGAERMLLIPSAMPVFPEGTPPSELPTWYRPDMRMNVPIQLPG